MRLRTLRANLNLEGKRVLVRIDANIPILHNKIMDGTYGKIAKAAVGLEWLRQKKAKIIVLTHLGRPRERRDSRYSTKFVAQRLKELMGGSIRVSPEVIGERTTKIVEHMSVGDIVLLENVRFEAGEKTNSPAFARQLAQLGDVYVNDAFANSHRAHASMDAITSELRSYAGPLLANEISVLSKIVRKPRKPFVLLIGGLKMRDKIPVLNHLAKQVDAILVGGALAHAFLVAQGYSVGRSEVDMEGVAAARRFNKQFNVLLPIDVIVVKRKAKGARCRSVSINDIGKDDVIVDIGQQTRNAFAAVLNTARQIVWNGPLGYCECSDFCEGTKEIARVVAKRSTKAITVVGGGYTGPLMEVWGLANQFTLLSTGGGAMLEFLAGKSLPGIEPLVSD